MKTTVEISDSLFEEAKAWAASHRLSFREIVEDGIRKMIAAGPDEPPFRLRDGSFGPATPAQMPDWAEIREVIYAGRGE